jgi:hypothetical protein
MPLREVAGLSQPCPARDSKTDFGNVGTGANISPTRATGRNPAALDERAGALKKLDTKNQI